MISIAQTVADDKMPPLLQCFPPSCAQILLPLCHVFLQNHSCITAVLGDTRGGGGCQVNSLGWTVVISAHSLLCQRGSTADSPHVHRLALLSPTLTEPPFPLPPSNVSTPPSGSSKYFPSLLFEASMGHRTLCTNHAGLPWGGGQKGQE